MSKPIKTTLGSLIEFQRGYDLPKSSFNDGKYPVISSNWILGYHNQFKTKGPGITIGRSGTVGLPQYVETNFFPHNTSLFVKDFKGNDPKYIFYILKTFGLNERKTGSGVPTMNRNHLHPLKVLAHLDSQDQQKIASILSDLDSKIELNNNINTELEAIAKTLYDYWFVQFDFSDTNGNPYKTSGGEMVWSEELKREVPMGWEVNTINKKVKIGSGFPFDSDDYSDSGEYKIITIKNVQDGFLDTSTVDKIDFIPEKITDFCVLKIGDVLMSLTGNVGRMCFVDQEKLLLNQRVGKFNGDKNFVNYMYLFFKRPENQTRLEKIAGGSSQSNLSPIDAVKDFFAIPPQNVLNDFSGIIIPIFDQMINNKQENQKLAELRDWLLPMLMNGQVVVE